MCIFDYLFCGGRIGKLLRMDSLRARMKMTSKKKANRTERMKFNIIIHKLSSEPSDQSHRSLLLVDFERYYSCIQTN